MNPYFQTDLGKLYHGDCLEIMPQLEPVDLVITSPPYDSMREYDGYVFDFQPIAKNIFLKMKSGGVCVWVVCDETKNGSESGTSFRQALGFYGHWVEPARYNDIQTLGLWCERQQQILLARV
jgi:DNA modification methylase